jgi:ABC-type multidrug transport system fused ATPase/permease subunit
MINPQSFYTEREAQYQNDWDNTTRRANTIAMWRLFTFIALGTGLIWGIRQSVYGLTIVVSILLLVVFLALVTYHLRLKKQVLRLEHFVRINRDELTYLSGDSSAFEAGQNFINPEHPYSFDLDIFGQKSIYQSINRTTTIWAKQKLAARLENPALPDISAEQLAVQELANLADWRQNFQAAGEMYADKNERLDGFRFWLEKPVQYASPSFLRLLSFVLPIATILVLILNLTTDQPILFDVFKALGIANLVVVASQFKNLKEEQEQLTRLTASLQRYVYLLQAIENQSFQADILRGLQKDLKSPSFTSKGSGTNPSQAIKELSQLLNQLDVVANPLVTLLVNGLFQYHLHTLFALAQWKKRYGSHALNWFERIADFEVLSSLANFSFNHPDFIFPRQIQNTAIAFRMVNLGHPLIPKDQRVGNDAHFSPSTFIVLTGSNMSGKSTFLRTLGANLILAKAGAPVCATAFEFTDYPLFISMRVNDSLQNSESFFFAELKRLKRIISQLEQGQKTFVILDEILRGTNSNDKRVGTQGLIKKLLAHQAVGIIATHDLVIGDMVADYPNALQNKCFEVMLQDSGLAFDYKLRDGVAQQMSAAYLMAKMGIV